MAYECFILYRTVKTLCAGCLGSERRAGLSFVQLFNPGWLSLVDLSPQAVRRLGGGCFLEVNNLDRVHPSFWKKDYLKQGSKRGRAGVVRTLLITSATISAVIYYLKAHLSKAE